MAISLQTVRRLTIESRTVGVDETSQKLARLGQAQEGVAASSERAARQAGAYEQALASQQRSIDLANQAYLQMARDRAALTSSMQQQAAANDNVSRSFTVAGLEAAEMANHLRTAATAAYTFSPAFREVVNGMAAPALRGAGVALVAVAGGLVTGTNLAGAGLVRLGASSALATASLTPVAGAITSAGLAMQAFNPSLTGVASTILGRLLPALRLLGAVGVVLNAAGLLADAWRLGGEELERYRGIAESAAKVDLSTTYFQKLIKGAEDAKVPVDALTLALTNLQKSSADQLGGSALESRLAASVKAGNFGGNSGVQDFAQANTTQQRFEAIVSLINQAMTAGQRLAALDIAGTAFGPEVVENLRKDSEYLDKIKAAADKVAEKTLVSPEDIGRAIELQNRYDAAVKLLETRWHPVQNLLTQAGIEFHANWVATVETIAQGFDWAAKLVAKLGDVPAWFAKKINEGSQWIIDSTTTPESRKAAEVSGGITSDPVEMAKGTDAYAVAVKALAAGLRDRAEMERKVAEANTIAQKTLGDTSKEIRTSKGAAEEQADAYDRALESVVKHTARLEADAKAVGLGAGALDEYRARTQLMTAAQLAGREMTSELTAQIEKQAKAAGEAGRALALARAESQVKFASQTLFMSSSDLSAANVMHNLYGDEWQSHMDDALAKQIKMNAQLSEAKGTAQQFATSFVQGLMSGKSGMDSLVASADQLASKLADKGIEDLFSGNFIEGGLKLGASALISAFTGDQKAKKQMEQAQSEWKKAGPAFELFLKQMTGGAQGEMSARIAAASQQTAELSEKADKAGNRADVMRIQNAFNVFQGREARQFISTFAATIEGLADGLGPDSPYLRAVEGVKNAVTYAKGFLDDAAKASEIFQGTWVGGGANEAAQKYVTSILETKKPLSDVATQLLTIKGTAAALQGALTDLGMSQQAAADAINRGVTAAMASLKAQFESGLTARLNTAGGKSYLNDALSLLKQHEQDVTDAAALGVSASLVSAVFQAEAQKIVDDAGLVGDAFTDFTKQFPNLANVVTEASGDIAAAVKQQQEALNASAKNIVDYINGLTTGSQSTLSPGERLNAAQGVYNTTLALAQTGNADAQARITTDAEALRSAARDMYGSTIGYQSILDGIKTQLLNLPAVQQTTDPVVQAMRDVLIAVQATTAAVNANGAAVVAAYDRNGDGFISKQEAANTYLAGIFSQLDTNQDGLLSELELNRSAIGAMQGALIGALAANSPSAIAGAFLTSGAAGLTFDQFKAGFPPGLATDSTLAGLYGKLDTNKNGIVSQLELLQAALKPAIDSGNAASIATALSTYFNTIATNTDAGITLADMNVALAGMASVGALRSMFMTLDADNSGSLSKLELISSATQGTKSTADAAYALTAATNTLLNAGNSIAASIKSVADSQVSLLSSINNLQNTASAQLSLLNTQYGTAPAFVTDRAGNPFAANNTVMLALNKIVLNTYATAMNTSSIGQSGYKGWPYQGGTYATGGYISGPGTGTSDSIPAWLSNGEGVITAAMTERLGGRQGIDNLNAGRIPVMPVPMARPGNDNGELRAVIAELREVRRELGEIKGNTGRTVGAVAAGAQHVREGVDEGNALHADNNKRARRA